MIDASLADCVALVTGASRGIGRTMATELAARGASIAAVARSGDALADLVDEIGTAGGRAIALPGDVTSERDVASIVAEAAHRLGPIDLLVNNAGGCNAIGPLWDMPFDEWWADIELNLKSAVLTAHAALPAMVARGRGRVVNLGSLLATGPSRYQSAYATAKVGLLLLTESLEQALAGTGVHAYAMSPGLVRTPGFERTVLTDRGRRWLPEIATVDPAAMVEPAEAAALLVRIARGDCDELAGRFLHVRHDLDGLRAEAAQVTADDRYVMRLRG